MLWPLELRFRCTTRSTRHSAPGHESRATKYATAALGQETSHNKLHGLAALSDVHASITERFPSRTAGSNGARAVGPEDGLLLTHPATGASVELRASALEPEPDRAVAVNEQIVRGLPGPTGAIPRGLAAAA